MKKGQSAFEFLMIYGWAIIGILISLGALFYFGFSPQKYLPFTCRFGSPLECIEWRVSSGGEVYITVLNTLDRGNMNGVNMKLYREDSGVCQMTPVGSPLQSRDKVQ